METKTYLFDAQISEERYSAFLTGHRYCSCLQSPAWAKVKTDWQAYRTALLNSSGEIEAVAQVLVRPLLFGLKLFYVPHGPVLDYENQELLLAYLSELRKWAGQNGAMLLKLHPPFLRSEGPMDSSERSIAAHESEIIAAFEKCQFRYQGCLSEMGSTIQPRFQAVVRAENWQEPPSAKIKYALKQVEKRPISLSAGTSDLLDDFAEVIRLTEIKQNVKLRDRKYFARMLDAFGPNGQIHFAKLELQRARLEAEKAFSEIESELQACPESSPKKRRQLEEVLASRLRERDFYRSLPSMVADETAVRLGGILVIRNGTWADMPYAGSDEQYGKIPYMWALYVKGIRDSFAAGCTRYNLGGVEGSLDDGLSSFKAHFNPVLEETLGEFDAEISPLAVTLFRTALSARALLAKAKARAHTILRR